MPLALVFQALIALFLGAIGAPQAAAQPLRAVPALTARVIDETATLNEAQRQALEARLLAIEQQHGSQVVVLMVATTAPEDIAAFANRVGNAWKIGRKEVGDGVLVLVAKDDRRMRIEVAKALEGAIPDIAAARIIDGAMKPRFREGDFAGGLDAAVQQIGARIAGEALPPPQGEWQGRAGAQQNGFDWTDLAIFLFFGVMVAGPLARRLRAAAGRPGHGRRRGPAGLHRHVQPAAGRRRGADGAALHLDLCRPRRPRGVAWRRRRLGWRGIRRRRRGRIQLRWRRGLWRRRRLRRLVGSGKAQATWSHTLHNRRTACCAA